MKPRSDRVTLRPRDITEDCPLCASTLTCAISWNRPTWFLFMSSDEELAFPHVQASIQHGDSPRNPQQPLVRGKRRTTLIAMTYVLLCRNA